MCMWVLHGGHSGDGCVLASTLCKDDLRKGDLFVLNWTRVHRIRDKRCMFMAHVCFYVCYIDCGVCGNVWCVAPAVEDNVFSLGVLKFVVGLCKVCDGCCVFCLYCDTWSCRCSCMASLSVSSCRCVLCAFRSNSQFCMTCSLLMLVEDARGDHVEKAYSRAGLMTPYR